MICRERIYACTRAVMLTCMMLLFGVVLFAQSPSLTVLKTRLQNSKHDTARLSVLLQMSNYYNNLPKPLPDANTAITYASNAEKLSASLHNNRGLGNSYLAIAKGWRNKRDSIRAFNYLHKAKNIFVTNNLFKEAAETVLNMEEFYQYFGGTDLNVRIAYYEQAFPLFQRSTAKDRLEATFKVLGDFYFVKGDYGKSMQYLQQALAFEPYIKPIDKESLYDLLGTVNAMMGNLNKALEYGLLAIKMTELSGDKTMQACAVYNRVGITYYNMKQFDKAKFFYEKSLAIAVKYGDIPTQLNQYVNIAQTLTTQDKFKESITFLKKVEKKYSANDIIRQVGVDLILLKCYVSLKRFKEAEIHRDRLEAARLNAEHNSNYLPSIESVLTAYYVATLQDKPARKHLALFRKLAIERQNPIAMAIAYSHQARLDSAQNNFKSAYKNFKKAGEIRDSIWNENQSKQVAQLQIQFETEKKDQLLKVKEDRIKLLNNQARLQQINLQQEKTTQRLIIGGAILLMILLGLSYNGYRLKQRVNRQLQAQRVEIEHKNESLTQLVLQKDNLLEEKEWLMKEIHHRVKNNLQIVISLLSTQSNYLDNDIAYNAIRESQHRMQSISLIHQKLYQSENLALVDINSYIADLVTYLRDSFDTGTRITFEMDITDAELDVTRAVPLGLILNEAITNAIKYAFPDSRNGKISISLKPKGQNAFALTIHDNGIGLPPTIDIAKSKSLGMSLMWGLSKQLGGTLKVESGDGITIIVDFVDENLLKAV